MIDKTEIQDRIQKCESREAYLQREHDALKSEIASLKADLTKCNCEDKAQAGGIEQEKCWSALDSDGAVCTALRLDGLELSKWCGKSDEYRPAYMPECRQVTAEDAVNAWSAYCRTNTSADMARELHKAGFRMKVTP